MPITSSALTYSRRSFMAVAASSALTLPAIARAQQAQPAEALLISNVRLFDGVTDHVRPASVLVIGDKIAEVAAGAIQPPAGARVIDGGGRVLMPGMTDAHWHMVFAPNSMANMEAADTGLMYAAAVAEAERRCCQSDRNLSPIDARRPKSPRYYLTRFCHSAKAAERRSL